MCIQLQNLQHLKAKHVIYKHQSHFLQRISNCQKIITLKETKMQQKKNLEGKLVRYWLSVFSLH